MQSNGTPLSCQTFLAVRRTYTLRFKVTGLRRCSGVPTENPVFFINGETSSFHSKAYCHVNDTTVTENFDEVYSQTLNLTTVYNSPIFLFFYIDFYTMHYGKCDYTEISCNGCIEKDLACDPSGIYCPYDPTDLCTDIKPAANNTAAIAGIICGCFFMFLILLICCWCHRQKLPCFKDTYEEQRSIATRARAIFAVQLASRGVESNRDGNDNAAYTEDGERIDPSLAEAPPAYSSLEHDNKAYTSYPEDGELPPSYDDATQNQVKYNVKETVLHI